MNAYRILHKIAETCVGTMILWPVSEALRTGVVVPLLSLAGVL